MSLVDSQIVNERFLVFLNDFLASGNIPDLFTNDLKDEFRNAVRNEAKQAGLQDTPENLWDFFIEKSRSNLHLILCFSPRVFSAVVLFVCPISELLLLFSVVFLLIGQIVAAEF